MKTQPTGTHTLNPANREFLYFWLASLLSILSYNFYIFNVGWFLLEVGARRLSVSLSWAVFFLPGLLLSFRLKKLLQFRNLGPYQMLALLEAMKVLLFGLGIFLLEHVPSPSVAYGISMFLGVAYIFFTPLTYSVLKSLSERHKSTRLSELIEISYQVAGAIALVTSGILYKHIGFSMLVACACGSSAIACLAHIANARNGTQSSKNDTMPEESVDSSMKPQINGLIQILKGRIDLRFGLIHLIPQMSVLLFNIPLFMYVDTVMKRGPETFGYVDGLFSLVALVTGLMLSKKALQNVRSLSNVSACESFGLAVLFLLIGFWQPPAGLWPYILLPMVGVFSTGLKIHSRSIILKTHSAAELSELTVYYQAFGNIFLVLGAVAIGYIAEHYGVVGAFSGLASVISLFGCCAWILRAAHYR